MSIQAKLMKKSRVLLMMEQVWQQWGLIMILITYSSFSSPMVNNWSNKRRKDWKFTKCRWPSAETSSWIAKEIWSNKILKQEANFSSQTLQNTWTKILNLLISESYRDHHKLFNLSKTIKGGRLMTRASPLAALFSENA